MILFLLLYTIARYFLNCNSISKQYELHEQRKQFEKFCGSFNDNLKPDFLFGVHWNAIQALTPSSTCSRLCIFKSNEIITDL